MQIIFFFRDGLWFPFDPGFTFADLLPFGETSALITAGVTKYYTFPESDWPFL